MREGNLQIRMKGGRDKAALEARDGNDATVLG